MSEDFLPFVRPAIGEDTIAGVADVLRSGWITTGPQVAGFEAELAAYVGGGRAALGYCHATGALEQCLRALDIGPGDEVIVPDMTFAATMNVVFQIGATPVLVDVDFATRNLDAARVEAVLSPRTRAIMPVHYAGLAVDMDPINALARKHGLRIVEDAAHAIGTRDKGRLIGSFGDIVCFSFHANKNLTTIEGGAVVTTDAKVLERLRVLRFHGQVKLPDGSYDIIEPSNKYNLSDVSARIGRDQLATLDARNAKRRALAMHYFDALTGIEHIALPARGDGGHAWHMFAVCIDHEALHTDRKSLRDALQAHGIGTGVHYPALHQLSVCKRLGARAEDFPNADRIGKQTLTLPLFPEMTESDVDRVAHALRTVLHG
ncbi:MAG TPA: DegT/DnrJ/EryC1/StrS aminotransferase family protein [Rhodanobacteraceae bacterium]